MARHDKISSTEKLLNLIRSEATTPDNTPEVSGTHSSTKLRKSRSAKIIPFQKGITVGVDIGYQDLRLAKVTQTSFQQWKLLDYTKVPFEPRIPKESPEFSDFLKSALTNFCGPSKKIKLWSFISSAQVKVYHFLIPKVAKSKIANAVFWTSKKEIASDEKETILDYEVQGDVIEKGINKIAVLVYTAPKREVERITTLFEEIGFPLTGITTVPFAYQNLFRAQWLPTIEETIGNLYIGMGSSRIDIFFQGKLVFTRNIKTGLNSMSETLMEEYNRRTSGEAPEIPVEEIEMPEEERDALLKSIEELPAMTMEDAIRVLLSLSRDSPPLTEADPGFHLKEEEIFEMTLPAVERLTKQSERTFKYYENLGNERVTKIFISGGIDAYYKPFIDNIRDQLGIDIDIIDPLDEEDHFLDSIELPGSISNRISYIPAIGLALADNSYTPNFMFTYKEKGKVAGVRRLNRSLSAAFLCILAVCAGIFLWQLHLAELKKAKIAQLDRELSRYTQKVDQNLILLTAARLKTRQKDLKEYSEKYLGMAVLSDLSVMTPSHIRLLNIMADFGGIAKDKAKESIPKSLSVDGIILGTRGTFESSLAGYVMKLDSSPLFGQVKIAKSKVEYYGRRQVLRFTLDIQLA